MDNLLIHLVRKRTLKDLTKLANFSEWLSVRSGTKWLWVQLPLQALNVQISRLSQAQSSLTFQHLQSVK